MLISLPWWAITLFIILGLVCMLRLYLAWITYKIAKKYDKEVWLWVFAVLCFGFWAFIIFLLFANMA